MSETTTIIVPTWALLVLIGFLFLDWALDVTKEILKRKIKVIVIDFEIAKLTKEIMEKSRERSE